MSENKESGCGQDRQGGQKDKGILDLVDNETWYAAV